MLIRAGGGGSLSTFSVLFPYFLRTFSVLRNYFFSSFSVLSQYFLSTFLVLFEYFLSTFLQLSAPGQTQPLARPSGRPTGPGGKRGL